MPASAAQTGRLLQVTLAVALGLALVGYLVGIRAPASLPAPASLLAPAAAALVSSSGSVVPGQPYWELRERRFGPNSRVSSDVSVFQRGFPSLTDQPRPTPAEQAAALEERARLRAYAGAPPVVPHAVDELSTLACLACHEAGALVGGRLAPPMSHSTRESCTQCHVSAAERPRWMESGAPGAWAGNSFVGLPERPSGARAWAGAPPTLPHPSWMRERCASCHGVAGRAGLRTSHPGRQSCPQCHALSDELAQ